MENKIVAALNIAGNTAWDYATNRSLANRAMGAVIHPRGTERFIRLVAFIAPEAYRVQEAVRNAPAAVPGWMVAYGTNAHGCSKIAAEGINLGLRVAEQLQLDNLEAVGLAAIAAVTSATAARVALNIYQNAMIKVLGSNLFSSGTNAATVYGLTDMVTNGAENVKTASQALKLVPQIIQTILNR